MEKNLTHVYMMLNSNLAVTSQEKDLSVVTDSFLKSLDQCSGHHFAAM